MWFLVKDGILASLEVGDVTIMTVTDMDNVWTESLDGLQLKKRLAKLNPAIDLSDFGAPIDRIKQEIEKASLTFKDNICCLSLSFHWPPLPNEVKWQFELAKADDTTRIKINRQLVTGLAFSCQLLSRQTQVLKEVISEKDYHIRSIREQFDPNSNYIPPAGYRKWLGPFEEVPKVDTKFDLKTSLRAIEPIWDLVKPQLTESATDSKKDENDKKVNDNTDTDSKNEDDPFTEPMTPKKNKSLSAFQSPEKHAKRRRELEEERQARERRKRKRTF
uniref:ARAD1B12430p n=1 Tax=Blastobotrys adeninivorans TaxID=409370 RepID=A0A060T615_BLAAD